MQSIVRHTQYILISDPITKSIQASKLLKNKLISFQKSSIQNNVQNCGLPSDRVDTYNAI